MLYRKFGKSNFMASALGMGCMRLPLEKGKDSAHIDEKAAIEMIHHAIDSGINYIDTAYPYHSGNSERVVGRALKGGYREKVKLATKLPIWLTHSSEDFDKLFDEQLKKMSVDRVDVYLLHALDASSWKKAQQYGFLEKLDQAKKQGKLGFAGFSFHGTAECFREIIDAYDWDMCQIQFNIIDEHIQAGVEGLRYAAAKGIAVVVMEPLKGGSVITNAPAEARKIMEQADISRTPQDWALRWVADFEEVSVILSGMSNMEQLKDNIAIMNAAPPHCLSESERKTLERLKPIYQNAEMVGCTACGYCMPCPSGVNIPEVFKLYNNTVYDSPRSFKKQFDAMESKGEGPSACIACGKCEKLCPQHIPVIETLKEVKKLFDI